MASEQYSSFQIGKMLNVSRQAVNQWIDKGYIESYRTPGGHRRVRKEDLLSFLTSRNIPVPEAMQEKPNRNVKTGSPLVYMVDDDTDFLELMSQALKTNMPSAQLTLFDNGYDALIAIGAHQPDVLLLDLKMPNINGLEVCQHLKKNPKTADLPIIVVSAYDSQAWRENLESLKVDQFYSKTQPLLETAEKIAGYVNSRVEVA